MKPNMDNPFPGMNPFMERRWADVHLRLMGYLADALAEDVPLDLSVRVEERDEVETPEGETQGSYRADVSVTEAWKNDLPPIWQPEGATGDQIIEVAEPEIIVVDPKP